MNLDSIPLDVFQKMFEKLPLRALVLFASTCKSYCSHPPASVSAKAMHARIVQLKEEEDARRKEEKRIARLKKREDAAEAAAENAESEDENHWFPGLDGDMPESDCSDWSEDEF